MATSTLNRLLSPPSISGKRFISPLYQTMGTGLTNNVLLIGHADAERMETPFLVQNMHTAIKFLGSDMTSPLLRGLIEAYNSGARDIYLYALAPMNEYEENPGLRYTVQPVWGGLTFYQKYYQRLTEAYKTLVVYDQHEIVIPLEAPFYDSGNSDFLTQLANFCNDSFNLNGSVSLGIMGTRVPNKTVPEQRITNYNNTTIDAMVADNRIKALGAKGKFVTVFVGEGVFIPDQASIAYNRSLEASIGALLARVPIDRSITGMLVPGVASTTSPVFTKPQLEKLAIAKLNPISKTAQGRRGFSFQVKIMTDNTTGEDGTDYWSLNVMRTVASVINKVRTIGINYIGEGMSDERAEGFQRFQKQVYDFMKDLENRHYIQQSSTSITRNSRDPYKAYVEISIKPNVGVRHIYFAVEVGPSV